MAQDYTNIDQPYNNYLQRSETSTNNGNVENQPVKSDGAMSDVWIKNFIRSEGWRPKTSGFYINGQTGYAEFSNVYVSGNIQALTGAIGGFVINAQSITDTADSFGLSSEGNLPSSVRLWAGATYANRAGAPFAVTADGHITGSAITVSHIDIPDLTTAASFHVDMFGNSWWGTNEGTGYATAPAYVLSNGNAQFKNVVITGTSTIGGTSATKVGAAISNVSGNVIVDVINGSLDTLSNYIKDGFTFTVAGAFRVGTTNDGVSFSQNGILGRKTISGVPTTTFAIANDGTATFRGTVTASDFVGGTIRIGGASGFNADGVSGIWLGTNNPLTAPFSVTLAGAATVRNMTIVTTGGMGSTGALRWTGGSKVWEDASGYMGLTAAGGRIDFSTNNGATLYARFQTGAQAAFYNGVSSQGNFNVTSGTARFQAINVYFDTAVNTEAINGGSGAMDYFTSTAHTFHKGGQNRLVVGTHTSVYNGFFNLPQLSGATAAGLVAQNGSMYYNTDTNQIRVRMNTGWQTLYP